jgi:multisubunit Na+/H+ antiporter MnhC subunit
MNLLERADQRDRLGRQHLYLGLFLALSLLSTLAVLIASKRGESAHSVFELSNYLGETTRNLAETGQMILVRTGVPYIGQVEFHAARMPFPIYLLLWLHRCVGVHFALAHLIKAFMLLLPIYLVGYLAIRAAEPRRRALATALVTLPFLLPCFMLQVNGLQTEEAFFYSLFAAAFGLVLFAKERLIRPAIATAIFIVAVDLTYLTKSSMRFVCVVLVAAMFLRLKSNRLRAAVVVLTLAAPIGWGLYSLHTSGRFTFGSSLDGFNLHKGNYAEFIDRYPPSNHDYMDKYDGTITPTAALFHNEWEDNDYHLAMGKSFIRDHFAAALRADLVKSYVFFLDLRDIGSKHDNDFYARVEIVSMLAFRALLLGAIAWSVVAVIRRKNRANGIVFLLVVAAAAMPYIAGFALTRHAVILLYPSAVQLASLVGLQTRHER